MMQSLLNDTRLNFKWSTIEQCENKFDSPQSRNKHASCHHAEYIYVIGGKYANVPLKDLWRFHINKCCWERLCYRGDNIPHLEGHSMLSYKRIIVVFGGAFGNSAKESSLWIINPDLQLVRKAWSDPSLPLPGTRRYHSSVLYLGLMYVFGGYIDIRGSSAELWAFHIDDEEWKLVAPQRKDDNIPGGRHGHSAVVHTGDMWVYGGMTDMVPKSDLWTYNFRKNKWTKIKCRLGPPPLIGHSACVIKDLMIVFGGETGQQLQNDMWIFCFWTLKWRKIELHGDVPSPRNWHTAVDVTPQHAMESSDSCIKAHSVPFLQHKHTDLYSDRPQSSPGNMVSVDIKKNGTNYDKNKKHTKVSCLVDVAESCLGFSSKQKILSTDKSPLLTNEFQQLNSKAIGSQSELSGIVHPNWELRSIKTVNNFNESHDSVTSYSKSNGSQDKIELISDFLDTQRHDESLTDACCAKVNTENFRNSNNGCSVLHCSLKSSAHSLPGQIINQFSPHHHRNSPVVEHVNDTNTADTIADLEIFLSCQNKETLESCICCSETMEMKMFSSSENDKYTKDDDSFHGIVIEKHTSTFFVNESKLMDSSQSRCDQLPILFDDNHFSDKSKKHLDDYQTKPSFDFEDTEQHNNRPTKAFKDSTNLESPEKKRNYEPNHSPCILLFGGKENKGVVGGKSLSIWKCDVHLPDFASLLTSRDNSVI